MVARDSATLSRRIVLFGSLTLHVLDKRNADPSRVGEVKFWHLIQGRCPWLFLSRAFGALTRCAAAKSSIVRSDCWTSGFDALRRRRRLLPDFIERGETAAGFWIGDLASRCRSLPVELLPSRHFNLFPASARYHHPTRAARAGTPVRSRFCSFRSKGFSPSISGVTHGVAKIFHLTV
jgi:hypothetical protein